VLLTKTVMVKWNPANKEWYENKGYIFTKWKDEFEVKVEDLTDGSHSIVEVLCDYCNSKIIPKEYRDYLRKKEISTINKDCCYDCKTLKTKESNLSNYNVEYVSQIQEVKERISLKH